MRYKGSWLCVLDKRHYRHGQNCSVKNCGEKAHYFTSSETVYSAYASKRRTWLTRNACLEHGLKWWAGRKAKLRTFEEVFSA